MQTSDLTNGERLLVLRRRRSDKSQKGAAAALGISLYKYRRWEADDDEPPKPKLGALESHEAYFIMRRRAGKSLQELATEVNVSSWWLCQMEYGRAPLARLVAYWAPKACPWRPSGAPKALQGA